jgi:hypothetical protein
LRAQVPNGLFGAWMQERYGGMVSNVLRILGRPGVSVMYVPAKDL